MDAALHHFGQDFRSVAQQADRDRFARCLGFCQHRHRFIKRRRGPVEIAGAQAHLDAARLAFDREARSAGHHRRQRLRTAHAAKPGGEQPLAAEVAAMMLTAHLDEGFVSALHDPLGANVNPGAGGHLAVHRQPLAIEFVEMFPIRPFRDKIGIGDQHPRRIFMGAKHADRLAGLDQQGFVRFQPLQRFDDPVIAFPVARGSTDAAIDDKLLRPFRDVRVQIVHQHPQRRFGEPALC